VEGELNLPRLPLVPGHQIVGYVEEIGKEVKKFKIGDKVGVTWLYSTCKNCSFCLNKKENLCEKAEFTGLSRDGGYAQYMVSKEDFTFPLQENLSDLHISPLLCAGVIGYRSLKISQIKKGGNLGLYGFGASAHIVLQIAKYYNCKVYVFTRSKEHQRQALELGAVWSGEAKDNPLTLMDSSIIFAPAGWIVLEALRVLQRGGKIAINAIHLSPIPQIPYDLLYYEKSIQSVSHTTSKDAEEFLELTTKIPIKTQIEVFSLEEANLALQKVKKAEIMGAAVLKILN
jgi:propanol-preferring alcohol dehydrogenase